MTTALSTRTGLALWQEPDTLLAKVDELGGRIHITAMQRKLINNGGRKPLRDYDHRELTNDLGTFLRFLFLDLQLKAPADAMETKYAATRFQQLAVEHYGDMTLNDMKGAFELYLTGDLEGRLPAKHEHYQQFSPKFYLPILKAYKQFQRETLHDVNGKVEMLLMESRRGENPGEGRVAYLSLLKDLVRAWCDEKQDGFLLVDDRLIHTMKRCGLLLTVNEPSEEDIAKAKERTLRRKGGAVVLSITRQLREGIVPDDVAATAFSIAVRKQLLEELWAVGADSVCAALDRGIAATKLKYNITDEPATEDLR